MFGAVQSGAQLDGEHPQLEEHAVHMGLPPGASHSGVGPAVFSIGSAQVFIFVHFISDAVSPEKNSPLMVGCGYDLI